MPSRSREFAAYVPGLILRHFRGNPAPPTQAAGARLPAVALFADIAGSTKITNELTRLGRLHGPEEMYRILNAYYEPLVSQLNARGGDVIGFAGDAVMAIWPVGEGDSLGPAVRQATQAALEIQRDLNQMELAPGIRLSLRICLGAGEVSTALVGGKQGFWQLVASGPPMDQIRAAGSIIQIGEVYLSDEACAHLGPGATLERHPRGGAFVRQLADPPSPPDPASLPDVTSLPEDSLRPFVQRTIQESIAAGLSDYMNQARTVSVLFVRLGRPPGVLPSWQRVQDAMSLVQDAAARYEGTVAQFIEDDKGLISLLAFGLPMVGHEDDPRRAIEAAVFLQEHAGERGLRCAIGASTGLPFCGALGAPGRRVVYTVTGADVVRAARLMQLACDGEILCDEETHLPASQTTAHRFVTLPRFALKGYFSPVRVFRVVPRGTGQQFIQIGREREWELLLEALDTAARGQGRVIWLEGEEGAGVTALVAELLGRAAGRIKRLGVPDPAAGTITSAWGAVCADLFGLRGVRDLVRRQVQVEAFFATRSGSASLFNDWLGTSLPETSETRVLPPAERVAARDDLLFSLVQELARERPLLVVLQDAHRFDATERALARRIAALERVTLLATAEALSDPHELRDIPGALVVTLLPLDEPTLVRRLCERLRVEKLGERFVALLRERARGNPDRAAAEYVRLLDEGRLVTEQGVCELADPPVAPVLRTGPGTRAPLIGRASERGIIAAALDAVVSGQSRGILIEGDTGAGKSRLVEEARRMGEDRVMLVAVGHCSAVEASTPHFPWRAVCDELLGLSELADTAERGSRVLTALDRAPEYRPFAPLLNDLLGLQLPENEAVRQMTGQNRADNLNAVLTGLIGAAADGRPMLLLLEDMQWADPSSWRLAKMVRERLSPVAVVLSFGRLVNTLPGEYDQFVAERTDRITLESLSEEDTREFVRARFGLEHIANPLARLIWQRAQGNPLFIEQIAGHMLQAGLVAIEGGSAFLRSGSVDPDVPDTVRGLVTARIDRLPPGHQLTAKVSSVLGALFSSSALTAIYPDRVVASAVSDHIGRLVGERLLRQERADPDAVYAFPHPVLQQVCYEMLTRPQRQRLHQSAAEWFQSERAGGGPQFRRIAYHWGRAGIVDRQAEYLALAAEAALRDGAFREAATGFTEVLQLSHERFPTDPPTEEVARRAHWKHQLGEAHFGLGELPVAAGHFRESLALRGRTWRTGRAGLVLDTAAQFFRQLTRRLRPRFRRRVADADPQTREVAATYLRLGRICYFSNDVLPGTNAVLRALNFAERVGPSPELGLAYGSVTVLCGLLKFQRAARVYARLAESVARAAGNLPNQCLVLAYLAMYHLGQGNWDRVESLATEALDIAERLGDHQQSSDNATILAMLNCFRAEYPTSLRWCERVTASAARSGNAMHIAWTANMEGECYLRLGRLSEAEAKLKESAAGLRGNKSRTEEIRIEGMLAAVALRAGNLPAALEHAATAEAVLRETSGGTCSALEGLAGIAEARFAAAEREPRSETARKGATAALAELRKHSRVYRVSGPRAALYEGQLLRLGGRHARAIRAWKAGLGAALALRMPLEEALLREALARCLPVDSPERRHHLEAAITLYEKIGATLELNQLRSV